ncbi:MAG: hypothetical protein JWP81_3364 [Ferruginibacter sp.]|nr:hypothetical protein [Ferruginibacter sp.]
MWPFPFPARATCPGRVSTDDVLAVLKYLQRTPPCYGVKKVKPAKTKSPTAVANDLTPP